MKRDLLPALLLAFVAACITVVCLWPYEVRAQMDLHAELRYCGEPKRDADGTIHRSTATIAAFKRAHACPANGQHSGACPGWSIDHPIPLACGGCDAVFNMQWLPNSIKSCAGTQCKDRWERKVYCQ